MALDASIDGPPVAPVLSAAALLRAGTVALSILAAARAPAQGAPPAGHERVPREAIAAAMRAEQDFDRRATTNQSRLQTRVLLRLAGEKDPARPDGPLLFIDFEDWFQAYLEAVGLGPDEAPLSVRLSYEHQYDILVDARPGMVVERVRGGPYPSQALNVRWRSRRGTPRYSYRDPLSQPVLQMTFEHSVSYRLIEVGGVVVLDEIEGVSGRPVTGPLSLLFRVIGQAHAVWSRSTLSRDGWQVVVGKGRKGPFARTATVTIQPNGRVERDVPAGRADLAELERRLLQPIDVAYRPWRRD